MLWCIAQMPLQEGRTCSLSCWEFGRRQAELLRPSMNCPGWRQLLYLRLLPKVASSCDNGHPDWSVLGYKSLAPCLDTFGLSQLQNSQHFPLPNPASFPLPTSYTLMSISESCSFGIIYYKIIGLPGCPRVLAECIAIFIPEKELEASRNGRT